MKLAVRRFALIAVAHPVATSFLVALATRLIVVIATNLLHGGVVVGDEAQYLFLALLASEGELTTQDHLGLTIWGGYGESLFNTTRAFMWPLTALFWLFGPTRLVGQLLVVLLGAVTAAGAAALAHRLLRRPYALGAGLMVALFPSQIFWSSVVLRESLIWAGLAVMAVVVTIWQRKESGIALLLPVAAMALLFVTLVWLREQTAVVALWCAVPALLFGLSRRGPRILCVTCLAVVAPWAMGMGPGGVVFAEGALGRLGLAHAYMSIGADSSFGTFDTFSADTEVLAPAVAKPGASKPGVAEPGVAEPGASKAGVAEPGVAEPGVAEPGVAEDYGSMAEKASVAVVRDAFGTCNENRLVAEEGSQANAASRLLDRPSSDWVCIRDWHGGALLVDNQLTTSIGRLPHGLYHTMIRPLPWEPSSTWRRLAAGLESPLWIILYGLAGYGAWKLRGRYEQTAFPILIILAISFSGAVSHGNLGTAFRHRGQILFALAVLAMGGIQAIVDSRVSERSANHVGIPQPVALGGQLRNTDGGGT